MDDTKTRNLPVLHVWGVAVCLWCYMVMTISGGNDTRELAAELIVSSRPPKPPRLSTSFPALWLSNPTLSALYTVPVRAPLRLPARLLPRYPSSHLLHSRPTTIRVARSLPQFPTQFSSSSYLLRWSGAVSRNDEDEDGLARWPLAGQLADYRRSSALPKPRPGKHRNVHHTTLPAPAPASALAPSGTLILK